MKFVEVSNPMPAGFKGTTENKITDPTNELEPFWQKLSVLDRPLRIVHIGDSHVRGARLSLYRAPAAGRRFRTGGSARHAGELPHFRTGAGNGSGRNRISILGVNRGYLCFFRHA